MPSPSPTPTPSPIIADPPVAVSEVLDFISSLVSSLAWPLVVLALFLIFRKLITSLLAALLARMNKLKRVKVPGGVEAEWFEETVESLEETAEELSARKATPESGPRVPTPQDDVAEALAEIDPAAAVVSAFIKVERAAAVLLRELGEYVPRSPMIGIRKSDRIDPDLKNVIVELSHLRNAAAHHRDIEISFETARRYIDAANFATRELEIAASNARGNDH